MSPRAHVVLPWSLAFGLGVLAAAGWLRAPSSPGAGWNGSVTSGAAMASDAGALAALPASGTSCPDAGVGSSGAVLGLCLDRLARAGVASTETPLALGRADAGVDPAALACLARTDVADLARSAARAEIAREASAARAARGRAVSGALTVALGATEEDLDVMGDSVCAARALRDRTLAELEGAEGSDATVALEELRAERDAALADVETRLGPERYATFRGLGGVGMLADVLDCESRGLGERP